MDTLVYRWLGGRTIASSLLTFSAAPIVVEWRAIQLGIYNNITKFELTAMWRQQNVGAQRA